MQLPAPPREEETQIIEMLKSSFSQSLLKIMQEGAVLLRFPSPLASYYQQAPTQVAALRDTLLSSSAPPSLPLPTPPPRPRPPSLWRAARGGRSSAESPPLGRAGRAGLGGAGREEYVPPSSLLLLPIGESRPRIRSRLVTCVVDPTFLSHPLSKLIKLNKRLLSSSPFSPSYC